MKIFLICLGALIAFFILVLLLRVSLRIRYRDDAFEVFAKIGPLRLKLFPRPPKPEKAKKPKKRKRKKKEIEPPKKKRFKIGGFRGLCELISFALDALRRFTRPFRVDQLTFHVCIASGDPAKDAIAYGASAAALDMLMPGIRRIFKIKKSDILVTVDFEGQASLIFDVQISGVTIRILSAALVVFIKFMKLSRKRMRYE